MLLNITVREKGSRYKVDKELVQRFLRGTASISIGTFLQLLFGFLGVMVAVRIVSKEQFGMFVLLQVIASLFVAFSSLVLEDTAVTRFVASSEKHKKMELANILMCSKIFITAIIGIVIFICEPLISHLFRANELSRLLIYVPIFYSLMSFDFFFQRILQGFHRYKGIAISRIINGTLKFALILILVASLKMGIIGLILSFLLSSLGSVLFQYLIIPVKKRFIFDLKLYKQILKFGFPLGLNQMLSMIFTRIDRIMIGAMLNSKSLADYDIASRIPASCYSMYYAFHSVFFPNMAELFSNKKYKEAETILNNSLRLVAFITAFVALVLTFFQNEIVVLLFSERYLPSAPALSLLMISLCIGLIGNILGASLVALGQSDKPVKINIIDTITNIIGNLLLIPIFGIMGAVYASLLSRCAANPVNVWFLTKTKVKLDVLNYLKPFLFMSLFVVFFFIIKPKTIVVKFLFIAFFVVFSIATSIVKKRDFEVIFSLFRAS